MNLIVCAIVAMVMVISVDSLPTERRKRWSIRHSLVEPDPRLSGVDLIDVLAVAPDVKYSDWGKKLTAVKNSRHKACFISDLDPGFNLEDEEMSDETQQKNPQVIKDPSTYIDFRRRAGPYITPMCQLMDIYWLNAAPPPVPLGKNPPAEPPQPIRVHVDNQPQAFDDSKAPPPLAIFQKQQQSSGPQTPPPVGVYQQQLKEQANHNVQNTERVMATPPPLVLHSPGLVKSPSPVMTLKPQLVKAPPPMMHEDTQAVKIPPPMMPQSQQAVKTPPPLGQWHPN